MVTELSEDSTIGNSSEFASGVSQTTSEPSTGHFTSADVKTATTINQNAHLLLMRPVLLPNSNLTFRDIDTYAKRRTIIDCVSR